MYNYYNYNNPEERPSWRSAYEIEIAALAHENRRIQMSEDTEPQSKSSPRGLFAFLLSTLVG